MINNARAESDARTSRSRERVEDVGDYVDDRNKRGSLQMGDSDGEGSYDDDSDTGPLQAA